MARTTSATCPRCGAGVRFPDGEARARCEYCRNEVVLVVPPQAAAGRTRPHVGRTPGLLAGVFLVMAVGAVVAWITAAGPAPADPAPAAPRVAAAAPIAPAPPPRPKPPAVPEPPTPPPAPPVPEVRAEVGLALVAPDGDVAADVLVGVSIAERDGTGLHYGVVDGATGTLRMTTPPLERWAMMHAPVGGVLLLAHDDGVLAAYDLRSGALRWETQLGEVATVLCAAPGDGGALVETASRPLTVDVVTGRQEPSRRRCDRPLARTQAGRDVSDRRDLEAPPGVDAWRCGGVRVMGSRSFSVPDACRVHARVDTDRLDGLVGHRLWRHGRGWLVMGVRQPGAYVPMVARLERGRLAWKAEVPAENPLEAEPGGPSPVGLADDTLYAAYRRREGIARRRTAGGRAGLAAFDARSGARRWTRAFTAPLTALAVAPGRIAALAGSTLHLLDPKTGEPYAALGPDASRAGTPETPGWVDGAEGHDDPAGSVGAIEDTREAE